MGQLTGKGTIIAILDSGIDYAHPDFCREDGTTRILLLWDQTRDQVFDSRQINEALARKDPKKQYDAVSVTDISGHGTHVAGIACGNGRASKGRYVGVAPDCEMIVVKLGNQREEAFPKTTELMAGVDFCLRKAYAFKKPVVINLSFGNNYGGHDGTSLLETYLNDVSDYWKSLTVVGTGNEGDGSVHTRGSLKQEDGKVVSRRVGFFVGEYDTGFSIQLWKNYADLMKISLIGPDGTVAGRLQPDQSTLRFAYRDTQVLVFYGMPSPYSVSQEIFFDLIPQKSYVDPGNWSILLEPERILEGSYSMWLPGTRVIGGGTGFEQPVEETTLTIPSTASKVLSVGAFDGRFLTMASFSGRGYTRNNQYIKPDVVAPGVDIMSTTPGGGYTKRTGTSMAAPYVSGRAACLMEEGIVRGKDPYLFGAKLIALMHRMGKPLPGYKNYPNPVTGWGRID